MYCELYELTAGQHGVYPEYMLSSSSREMLLFILPLPPPHTLEFTSRGKEGKNSQKSTAPAYTWLWRLCTAAACPVQQGRVEGR